MSGKVLKLERRASPRSPDLDRLYERVRSIEILLALIVGGLFGELGLKLAGVLK